MSVRRITTLIVSCEHQGCRREVTANHGGLAALRELSRYDGWRFRFDPTAGHKVDLCPEHARTDLHSPSSESEPQQ